MPGVAVAVVSVCSVEGCGRPVEARGLCVRHYMRDYKRRQSGSKLLDAPEHGSPSGFGRYGIMDERDGKVLCHECGRWFRSVGSHVPLKHGMSAREYRREHGIPATMALVSSMISEQISERSKAQVGTEGWKRLEAARDPAAASHARTPDDFSVTGIRARAESATANLPRRKASPKLCAACGKPALHSRRTCSDECAKRLRSEASRRMHAAAPDPVPTDAELDELRKLQGYELRRLIYRLYDRGVRSHRIATALGRSPAYVSQHFPRPKP